MPGYPNTPWWLDHHVVNGPTSPPMVPYTEAPSGASGFPPGGPPPGPPVGPPNPPAVLGHQPWVPAPSGRSGTTRSKVGMAAVAVLALAGGTTGGWLAGHSSTETSVVASKVSIARVSDTFSGTSLDVAEVAAKTEPSVVSIVATTDGSANGYGSGGGWQGYDNGQASTSTAAGSGVIITSGGQVLTNAHVISGASTIAVTLNSGKTYQARVVGSDTSADLALLQLEGASGLTPATLGQSSKLEVGDDVVAIGNALALEGGPTVTKGIVSALKRSIQTETGGTLSGLIQTDAAISSGNSGGPLVNAQGDVVGINSAVATSSGSVAASNIGFSISIDTVRSLLPTLRAGGTA